MRTLILSAAACLAVTGAAQAAPPAELPGRIRVLLPADAALTIDGEPTRSTSDRRDFVTPPLPADLTFSYDLRARFFRNGTAVTVERRVTVRAGQETVARLDPPGDAAPAPPPVRTYREVPPVQSRLGGPENNWKPDSTDPFYPWE